MPRERSLTGRNHFVGGDISMIQTKTRKVNGTSTLSISPSETNFNNFRPELLPNNVLDDLWLIATDRDMQTLSELIQNERFERLEKEVEKRYERFE